MAHPHSDSSSTWFLVELEFGNADFWGEGKTGVPGEKPLGARERTNNKLSPHMVRRRDLNPGHTGGRRVLSPLRHPCSPLPCSWLLYGIICISVLYKKKRNFVKYTITSLYIYTPWASARSIPFSVMSFTSIIFFSTNLCPISRIVS